ncbi:MAG: XRE family transcriptional regulator [Myxococcales bacterium]|nr:XRE family transcriptional regulator [Myxococcales bacterium]
MDRPREKKRKRVTGAERKQPPLPEESPKTQGTLGSRLRRVDEAQPAPASPDEQAAEGGAPEVGANLRRVRLARAMSLDALARASGVSRAMLSQVELGHSTPTIKVLWKIARAFELPFSALLAGGPAQDPTCLLRGDRARRLTSHDGRFSSRALFPPDRPRRVEFYELRLAPRGIEEAEPHPPGTTENLVVNRGTVEIRVDGVAHELGPGDALQFQADVPHAYRNAGPAEAVMYLVMSYAETIAASPGWNV